MDQRAKKQYQNLFEEKRSEFNLFANQHSNGTTGNMNLAK